MSADPKRPSASCDEVDETSGNDDRLHDLLPLQELGNPLVLLGRTQQVVLSGIGRDAYPRAQLAENLHWDLDRLVSRQSCVQLRPRLVGQSLAVPQGLPEFLAEVRCEGGEQQHEF